MIQKKIQKKSDFVVKGFINDLPKLEYFFEKFFECRNISGRYPTIEIWRENLVTELLENITENKITEFDIGEISNMTSSDQLKKSIYKWQINKIYLYDYGLNYLIDYHKENEISISSSPGINFPNIIENALEDIVSWSDYGVNNLHVSFKKSLENQLFDKSSEERYRYLQYSFETRLFNLVQNIKKDNNSLFGLDRILLYVGYSISRENIFLNNFNLSFYINNEFSNSKRFKKNNLIAKKYKEISQMILKLLNKDEKDLFSLRYGFNNLSRHTLKEIYIIKNYDNYQNLYEDLTRALWKIRITWPREIIEKILFGEYKADIYNEFTPDISESPY